MIIPLEARCPHPDDKVQRWEILPPRIDFLLTSFQTSRYLNRIMSSITPRASRALARAQRASDIGTNATRQGAIAHQPTSFDTIDCTELPSPHQPRAECICQTARHIFSSIDNSFDHALADHFALQDYRVIHPNTFA
jgi:hypothetical protein